MSQHAEMPALTWDELSVSELLPTGTVTLLLADVEGSTGLWESQPEQMAAALALLNRTVDETVAACGGVRPVEQGEGDSFVAAFARASDAVGCALALQRAPLAPIRIRIGLHTGEIQLRDQGNYAGPTINRTARIRDLAHGGQTVLSAVTESLVVDRLPEGVWLTDLGSYPLRGVPRPERVAQLCHPDLRNEFPPLRVRNVVVSHNLPTQLTSFVGRQVQMAELRQLITENRLVTLTGAGGAGKTRLALEVAAQLTDEFSDGVWYVDLAPITNPAVAPVTVVRTLGLPDEPGRSTMDTLVRFIGAKTMLLVLDNCEHLLDACGVLVFELLKGCPQLTIVTTSREPLALPGELSWRVPSLSLTDEAIDLFADRARRARPNFVVNDGNRGLVTEICERLDGMPLAIELAAARIRTLSLKQIADSLHDRFRLLTGGARTAVRRQQTLRASVDWSHALLTEPERVLFRRLGVFAGGFDIDAALVVGADSEIETYQLMDQLGLLVDKSLVVTVETSTDTGDDLRYGLLETVRQYAQEKLGESGEADQVRTRHRDYYADTAAAMKARGHSADDQLLQWAQTEIENLRAAFAWSLEHSEFESALGIIGSLTALWLWGGRVLEALAGLAAILADDEESRLSPAVWVGAVTQHTILSCWATTPTDLSRAQNALRIARQLEDPALTTQALIACSMLAMYIPDLAQQYFAEMMELFSAAGDQWNLCQVYGYQATVSALVGAPGIGRPAAEQARDLADALGDRFFSRNSRAWLAVALGFQGELAEATSVARTLADEAAAAGDVTMVLYGESSLSLSLSFRGEVEPARAAAQSALAAAERMGGVSGDTVYAGLAYAALAGGDAAAARQAAEEALLHTVPLREAFTRCFIPMAEALLACGDLAAARRWADDTIAVASGWYKLVNLTVRGFIALAQCDKDQSERDAHDALTVASEARAFMRVADTLECLARVAALDGNHSYAARLFGAADGIRQRLGHARYPMYQAGYDAAVADVRDALGQGDFDSVWADGAALSTEEAIAYAQRGRGERKRPASGWGSLTRMENDVVRLVREGLGNKEIGARLFVSPRTVQTHLTHVYAKLGVASRVQLVQEANRHD
ncbi:LuxR family transcriptional regulator [Mycobacterium paragordonae]|uniref:LuxR family transcriptional regulator n=1 Tax=Mycobacterium paragordonae TaxID=1389713 RepID=UPI0012E1140D|nr:LuxR family transcriptional regulator [Mycobacterium paragordonae]